ncbi:MAG: hypothetical protein AABZ80_09525 [Gemmatimonadota bacterium]
MLALTCAFQAQAQVLESRPRLLRDQWVWSVGAFAGLPLGDFAKNENGGGGFEFMLGFQPFRRQPLTIRTQIAALIYGNVQATGYQDVCDFFGCRTETVEYTARSHTMTSWHIGPEFFATDGFLRPFVYAMPGYTWFHSWANLPPTSPGGASPGSAGLYSSGNFSTVYGAGVRFIKTKYGREYGMEFASRVTRNTKANYLTDRGVKFNLDGSMTVIPVQGAANTLSIQVGFWMGPYINWNERRLR